jgi:hypothetical protein
MVGSVRCLRPILVHDGPRGPAYDAVPVEAVHRVRAHLALERASAAGASVSSGEVECCP